jgi:hypothetical protein
MSITYGKGRAATPAHNRVARYTTGVDEQGKVVAEPGSWKLLLRLANLRATNHNGGAIHFGSDGKLYVAVGENAREELAQSLKIRLGKILRINKDGTIPTDNPFYDRAPGSAKAIWARGLRNPYSFDVQPETGKIFINTSARKPGRRSTKERPAPTTAGPASKAPRTTPTPSSLSSPTGTASARIRAARSPAAPSTTPRRSVSEPTTQDTTSSRISARAGSASWIPRRTRRHPSSLVPVSVPWTSR